MPGDTSRHQSCLRRLLNRHEYGSPETEATYRIHAYPAEYSGLRNLVLLMIALNVSISVVNFIFVSQPSLENISSTVLCIFFVVVLIFLHTRYMSMRHLATVSFVVVLLCLGFAAVSFPVGNQSKEARKYTPSADVGVWRLAYVILTLYVFVPLRIYVALVVGFLLPLTHSLTSIFVASGNEFPLLLWRQVIANIIIYVAVNFVGIFCYDRKEKTRRRVFDAIRDSVAEQLRIQDSSDKMERILLCLLPPHVAIDMKTDLRRPHLRDLLPKAYIQRYNCVSIIFARIVGLSSLTTQCSSQELVRLANEIFGRFDQLSSENHCIRLQILGDCYFGVCGIPDSRPDHAKCCVELGLDMIDVLSFIRESTEANLGLRVGIHSGRVLAGVMGLRRWKYDVWSEDVELAHDAQQTGLPGRVHVTDATVDHLHGEFPTEPGNEEKSSQLKSKSLKTYFIVAGYRRKSYGPLQRPGQSSQILSIKDIDSITSGITFNAEIPFSGVAPNNVKLQKIRYNNDDLDEEQLSYSMSRDHTFAARVQKNLNQVVENKTIERNHQQTINCVTLCLKSSNKEKQFQRLEDRSFPTTVLCSLVLLVLSMAVQAVILPRTLLLLVIFVVSFAWISVLLIMILGYRIKCIRNDIRSQPLLRWIFSVVTIVLHFSMSFTNVLCCRRGLVFPYFDSFSGHQMALAFNSDALLDCDIPQYIYLSAILTLLAVVLFVRLTALVKLVIWVVIGVGYVVVIEYTNRSLFSAIDHLVSPEVPSDVVGVLMLLHWLLVLYISSRDLEWTQRMRFLWELQVSQLQLDLRSVQESNCMLMLNILPDHVTTFFREVGTKTMTELNSRSHSQVAVGFLSIVNLTDIYGLLEPSQQIECLKVLNEVIMAIDKLLDEDRYKTVCKINSFGTNYLTAVGLQNGNKAEETEEWRCRRHLSTLIDLIFDAISTVAQKDRSLMMRAGLSIGPLVAGVVGAKKPQYEIWGETVDTARKLEKTGLPNCIQVTEKSYQLLKVKYQFHCRGQLRSPGKPDLTTYFLPPKQTRTLSEAVFEQNHYDGVQPIPPTPLITNAHAESSSYELTSNSSSFGSLKVECRQQRSSQNPLQSASAILQRDPCNYFQVGKSSMTPPSSLGRRRTMADELTGSEHRKVTSRPPLAILRPEEDKSPDFPVYHYRNVSGTNGPVLENTLTQSQILRNSLTGCDEAQVQRQVSNCSTRSQRNSTVVGPSPSSQQPSSARSSVVDPVIGSRRTSIVDEARYHRDQSLTNSSPSKTSVSSQTSVVRTSFPNNQTIQQLVKTTNGSSDICLEGGPLSKIELEDIDKIMKEFITDIEKKPQMICQANRLNGSNPKDQENHHHFQPRPPTIPNNCQRSASFGTTTHQVPLQKIGLFSHSFGTNASVLPPDDLLQPAVEASVSAEVKEAPRLSLANQMFSRQIPGKVCQDNIPVQLHGDRFFAVKNSPLYTAKIPNNAIRPDRAFVCPPFVVDPPSVNHSKHGKPMPSIRGPSHPFSPDKYFVNNFQTPIGRPVSLYTAGRPRVESHNPQLLRPIGAQFVPRKPHLHARNSANYHTPSSNQPRRHPAFGHAPLRHARSLENINNDHEDKRYDHFRPSSPQRTRQDGFGRGSTRGQGHAPQDNVSLSSYSGSEMSRSDPTLSYDSSSAIESEYDNYRPGMASDEDYFVLEPISDVDLDLFDDIDIENVMVSDNYGSSFIPMLQKMITDV